MATKKPKLKLYSSAEVKKLRKVRKMNQGAFWGCLGVNQSAASRYENGRRIPHPIQLLLAMRYGTNKEHDVAEDFVWL